MSQGIIRQVIAGVQVAVVAVGSHLGSTLPFSLLSVELQVKHTQVRNRPVWGGVGVSSAGIGHPELGTADP